MNRPSRVEPGVPLSRRRALSAAASAIAIAGCAKTDRREARLVELTDVAEAQGPPLHGAHLGLVGVFDLDWLLTPRFTRLLDNFAASPRAFRGVRFFGALNSGEREDIAPRLPGGVWRPGEQAPDFSVTLRGLDTLVSRGLTPFVSLTFFPPAISASPIRPPAQFDRWQTLVARFIDAAATRFGASEIAGWWFEVWNEPNMPPFWDDSFERYLELYRATSEAVAQTGHAVRLGGPALAYVPEQGPALMVQFLKFLAAEPGLQCNFISYHRKGIWVTGEDQPSLARLEQAAGEVAQAVLRWVPQRARGLTLVNDEADMKVGFDQPFEPRMTERFPAWLAASLIQQENLNAKYITQGLRFVAACDDANQQLVREPFDGRRSVMTCADATRPDDLLKLPVYGFYEMSALLGDRRCRVAEPDEPASAAGLSRLATIGPDQIAVLFTFCPDNAGGSGWDIDYTLGSIKWPRVNIVWFCIDQTHGNAFTAAGGRMPAMLSGPAAVRAVRLAAELGVAEPIRSGVALDGEMLRARLHLAPFGTTLVWITPYVTDPPAAPGRLVAEVSGSSVVLRWPAAKEPAFYSYEVVRSSGTGPSQRIAPVPLRSALWVDEGPPAGAVRYAVRTVTASGVASPAARSEIVLV